ncbi:hypothetical protein EV356DRAFT_16954 [Viridothelium virens]|uniref:Uncharacterized protein n=1 Tax=Viridothelium virens TaxID=1048519 RepID=A0A6A6HIW3_VIRVR|nr:hypothetical protein EV356DRAFT_16954 [Viridothelium virens]
MFASLKRSVPGKTLRGDVKSMQAWKTLQAMRRRCEPRGFGEDFLDRQSGSLGTARSGQIRVGGGPKEKGWYLMTAWRMPKYPGALLRAYPRHRLLISRQSAALKPAAYQVHPGPDPQFQRHRIRRFKGPSFSAVVSTYFWLNRLLHCGWSSAIEISSIPNLNIILQATLVFFWAQLLLISIANQVFGIPRIQPLHCSTSP